MAHILSKYANLNDVQIGGMITYAQAQFPYLESTSSEALMYLCKVMLSTHFVLEKKATPIRSSLEFLRHVTAADVQNQPVGSRFAERDFVFAIKMFGLKVREKTGLKQFVPENELDFAADEEVIIDDAHSAKKLEFYVSDVQKRTKIQTNGIESATNRLLRDWREIELAKLFTEMMDKEAKTIGQARDHLRTHCGVKDHEFVRIREHAVSMGLLKSKRNPAKNSRRITLDEDVMQFVEELTTKPTTKAAVGPLSASQAVNQALRDLFQLTRNKPLSEVYQKAA